MRRTPAQWEETPPESVASILKHDDEVIGAINYDPKAEDASAHTVLVVSENGFGKRTDFDEYRITKRGGKGVKTISITEKTGKLIAIKNVTERQ